MKHLVDTRKLLFVTVFALATLSYPGAVDAQEAEDTGIETYVAAGLSIGNTGDSGFGETSYPSLAFGFSKDFGSLGLVVGRSSNDLSGEEDASNYWWEIKTALAVPVGDFSAYGLIGLGNYLSTSRFFVEYGFGVSHSWGALSLFIQASNWDGAWYVTPGLSYSL